MRNINFMNKQISLKFSRTAKLLLFLCSSFVATISSTSNDPYTQIRYSAAFDQTALYEKYKNLMQRLGCADNVFATNKDSIHQTSTKNEITDEIIQPWSSDNPADVQELADFQEECLEVLHSARRTTLMHPAFSAFNNLAFMGIANALILAFVKDSVAGGFAGSGAVYTALESLKESAKVGYNLIYKPDNSLEILEDHFAKNKCFIPQLLWHKITNEFVSARQSEMSRQQHTNFIDFTLGFTLYKPKPALHYKNDATAHDIKKELNKRIDHFFQDYNDKHDIHYIKMNVAKFIDMLCSTNTTVQVPRYVYLYGSGGIGKTHFVQTLAQWIDELIPNSVQFQDMIVNSADELEGSSDRPGSFLKVLRSQLIKKKHSSIVMIDEATWLNQGGMVSPAKRIFNGDRSKLITSYFGSNMDGSGVSLDMPPMLIFVASNEKITDPALESRFDTVHYPTPTQQALVQYAYDIAAKSFIVQQTESVIDKSVIAKWIANLNPQYLNFRYIAGNIESFILSQQKP
jgi:ATPase family associated with various cellular activities (AAA)